MKDNYVYVKQILEHAERIILFTRGFDEVGFLGDNKTQSAVIRELEVIGEAAKKVTDDFREKHIGIAWKLMAGMRDVLIHDTKVLICLVSGVPFRKTSPP